MSKPKKLSDIDVNVDGIKQDEIIENRKAGNSLMRDSAARGNSICRMASELDSIAFKYGINSTYSEDIDDDMDY